jgi:DNA-binding MarR family transcriptional regulator
VAKHNAARRPAGDPPELTRALRAIAGKAAASAPLALDEVIHHRLRLGMVSALAANESLSFTELRDILNTTDGNLSVHARKLEDAKYVHVTKRFESRRPRTDYKLTAAGRAALNRYLSHMESLIAKMRP